MTDVAAALIWSENKFMICQRPPHKTRGLLWEFAGGKVEPGESREEAGLSEGRFILHKTETIVYAAQLDITAESIELTQEKTVYSFRLIQTDWKTGET